MIPSMLLLLVSSFLSFYYFSRLASLVGITKRETGIIQFIVLLIFNNTKMFFFFLRNEKRKKDQSLLFFWLKKYFNNSISFFTSTQYVISTYPPPNILLITFNDNGIIPLFETNVTIDQRACRYSRKRKRTVSMQTRLAREF